MKAVFLALFFSVSVHSDPSERAVLRNLLDGQRYTIVVQKPNPQDVLRACEQPGNLVAAANALLRRYFKTDMYNSTLFDKFLWLHPEHEDFIACVICKSGKPNDPYWERDFIRMCNERTDGGTYLVDEPTLESDTNYL